VAQIISLGSGSPRAVPIELVNGGDLFNHPLRSLAADCEAVASELSTRLLSVDAYVRLNVEFTKKGFTMDDWNSFQEIESLTHNYVETTTVARTLDESVRYLRSRVGTATLGQISKFSSW